MFIVMLLSRASNPVTMHSDTQPLKPCPFVPVSGDSAPSIRHAIRSVLRIGFMRWTKSKSLGPAYARLLVALRRMGQREEEGILVRFGGRELIRDQT